MPVELLKERDKRFRLLFEDHPQPMYVFDAESQELLEANAAASQLYGYSREEFRSKKLPDLDAGPPPGEDRVSAAGGTAATASVNVWRHRTSTGRVIELETAVHDIQYGGRKARLAVLLDITGRRYLEEQLRQAQKMEAVGMLAGGVAHDFNNLLTIITGYSQLILNNLDSRDPNRHSVEQIMKAGERAAALTKQLLAFSRRQVLQPRVLDLNKLVSSLSSMLQRLIGEDIDLRLVLPPDLGRVNADPGQIEQVLMNLVVNARDAMPKGGVLTVETSNVNLDTNYAKAHLAVRSGPYVMVAVSDTGYGMDEATKARLFEPFFTTKGTGKGTGLGLSTVFGIVKQSGGSVEVYSEPGRGTSVKVYLPRIDQPVTVEKREAARKAPRGTETVLLVEDDEMVRSLVRETLERDGYKILDAAGPLEAKRISEQHKEPIQLLITDVVMPKISGRDLARQLTERRPGMKVLYMSGYTDNAVVNSGILRKEVAFLQKPFTPNALTEKVREVLEGDNRTRKAGE
ncbi:MAG TPA: ATP-binding protein [Bryobacteraceae bacterium]|jgi:PAS domain S-box-containing protein|nr:ATP-binding protein [Bryobacteraceae bacterium]